MGRVDSGKDVVAELDFFEAACLRGGEFAGGFEALPEGFEVVELVVVGQETGLGIVAGSAGGDE